MAAFALLLPSASHAALCKNVLGYYNEGSKPGYSAANIPYAKLTHICHAFAALNSDGSISLPAGFVEATLAPSAHAAGCKVLLSVGGGGGGTNFPGVAGNAARRQTFATAIKNFLLSNSYDGADIDWEYPASSTDRTNFNLMIADLRTAFNASPNAHPEWQITAAVSADPWTAQWLDISTLNSSLSFFNVMCYDFHGPWSSHSGHNGPLFPATGDPDGGAYSASDSINYYLGQGASASKINFGLAFYGYQFPVPGLNQSCGGGSCGAGFAMRYSDVAPLIGAGWTWHWDASAQSSWASRDAGGKMISYDDVQSIQAKAGWALNTKNLAGVFAWSLDQDDMGAGGQPLLDAMDSSLACGAPTFTYTATQSRTPTPSATPSRTVTLSATRTSSPSASPTPTFTLSPTSSLSTSASPSVTLTKSATLSSTPTPTFTVTSTPTFSATRTATASLTSSLTSTATRTLTRTPTPTATQTSSATGSVTPGPSATYTATPSATPSDTLTRTQTPTFTQSLTPSPGTTPVLTATSSVTATATFSATPSSTATLTSSATSTSSATPTSSPTPTSSQSATVTPTFTSTPTAFVSLTSTPSPSATSSATLQPTKTHGGGKPKILQMLAMPNPNPQGFALHIEGDADSVELRIYSRAQTCVAVIHRPLSGAAWQRCSVDLDLPNGFYVATAVARQGDFSSERSAPCKFLVLK